MARNKDNLAVAFNMLTPSQKTVFHHLLAGQSTEEIAERLDNSAFTISNHTRHVFGAFRVTSRSQLLALFVEDPFKNLPEKAPAGRVKRSGSVTDTVRSIEGFEIALADQDAAKLRATDYAQRYERSARGSFSVGTWIEKRFNAVYPKAKVTVLLPDGKRAPASKSLETIRRAYGTLPAGSAKPTASRGRR